MLNDVNGVLLKPGGYVRYILGVNYSHTISNIFQCHEFTATFPSPFQRNLDADLRKTITGMNKRTFLSTYIGCVDIML